MRSERASGTVEVEVERDVLMKECRIYLVERAGPDRTPRLLRPADGGWKWVELEHDQQIPGPTLEMGVEQAEVLMEGIAEHVLGVEDPVRRQSRAEARVEAMGAHLEDLRELIGLTDSA